MPESKVIARVVGDINRPDPNNPLETLHEMVEVTVNVSYEDGSPGTGTTGAFPWPVDEKGRSKIHQWLLQFATEKSFDYVEAKKQLAEALEHPRQDEPVKAPEVVDEPDDIPVDQPAEPDAGVTETMIGEPFKDKINLRFRVDDGTIVRGDADIRRRALAKLTLEEQKALGLADPRRLDRRDFHTLLSGLVLDGEKVANNERFDKLMAHFDCMEELGG